MRAFSRNNGQNAPLRSSNSEHVIPNYHSMHTDSSTTFTTPYVESAAPSTIPSRSPSQLIPSHGILLNPYSVNSARRECQENTCHKLLFSEPLHRSSSSPMMKRSKQSRFQMKKQHNRSSPDVMGYVDYELGDDDESVGDPSFSYLDDDGLRDIALTDSMESSSGSCSVYTNTPSFNPLVAAFHGAPSLSNILVRPCSER